MDIAVAGAAATLRLEEGDKIAGARIADARIADARVALAAVAPVPLYVKAAGEHLVGKEPSLELFTEAAELAREAADPIDDIRGSANFRRHLVGVLVRRALAGALARAAGPAAGAELGGEA
jgi:carbon-monoxide dehydrogenase medium subunit